MTDNADRAREIVDSWDGCEIEHDPYPDDPGLPGCLIEKIAAALDEARAEGRDAGLEEAERAIPHMCEHENDDDAAIGACKNPCHACCSDCNHSYIVDAIRALRAKRDEAQP